MTIEINATSFASAFSFSISMSTESSQQAPRLLSSSGILGAMASADACSLYCTTKHTTVPLHVDYHHYNYDDYCDHNSRSETVELFA